MFALETSSQGVIYPDRLSSAIVLGEAHDAAGAMRPAMAYVSRLNRNSELMF